MIRAAGMGLALLALAVPGSAQQEEFESVELRVISVRPDNRAVVDRGSSDGVIVGDLVILRPKSGGSFRGSVLRVTERNATVEMRDQSFEPTPGVRGEVLIPVSRRPEAPLVPDPRAVAAPPVAVAPPVVAAPPAQEAEQTREPPVWAREEDEWSEGMPLLARVQPVRPEERGTKVSGTYYALGNATVSNAERSNQQLWIGGDALWENPFGKGGGLHLDGEVIYRAYDTPDEDAESNTYALLRRASYHRGGTRFEPVRWEIGRFLQSGMYQFGVIDGVEWSKRRRNGDRYGVSLGYLPEPDTDHESFQDLQIAGFYRWAVDEAERLTIDGGYQKTWHDGVPDRDLFVTSIDYLPREGWDFRWNAWIDYYDDSVNFKDEGFELTQVRASSSRQWETAGTTVTFNHLAFPEIEREEFLPPTLLELAEARVDRLSVLGWKWMAPGRRLHGQVAGWIDEDDNGGDLELGIDVHDVGRSNSADVTLFGTAANFSTLLGGRLTYGETVTNGRWDAFYELGYHRLRGFSNALDELWQHRLRASRDLTVFGEWNLNLNGTILWWDSDVDFILAFYLQRTF
jgi:hypothetical protein